MLLAPSNISESTYRRQDIYIQNSKGRGELSEEVYMTAPSGFVA